MARLDITCRRVAFIVAKDGLFPKWFAKENKNGAPMNALFITNVLVQIFLISMLFTKSAYHFAFSLASAILYPYMFSVLSGEIYNRTQVNCNARQV